MTGRGKDNPNWKGGRSVASNGYVLVLVGKAHHLADVRGYAYLHRVVAELKIGRRLLPGEEVHHIDENPLNNTPSNLQVETKASHRAEHRRPTSTRRKPHEANPSVVCACGCARAFLKYDDSGRPRRYLKGHRPKKR